MELHAPHSDSKPQTANGLGGEINLGLSVMSPPFTPHHGESSLSNSQREPFSSCSQTMMEKLSFSMRKQHDDTKFSTTSPESQIRLSNQRAECTNQIRRHIDQKAKGQIRPIRKKQSIHRNSTSSETVKQEEHFFETAIFVEG